jgi:hypothetical protein
MTRTSKWLLAGAGLAGLFGGFFTFAVNDDKASTGAVDLQAVGAVLLAAAVILAAGMAVAATKSAKDGEISIEALRAVTGLVAVVAGIIAVAALTIVAVNLLSGDKDSESTVAITTSAFGIVSTVITAYLGIKATANTSQKVAAAASEKVEEAAVARYEAKIERKRADRLKEKIDQAEQARKAPAEAAKKRRRRGRGGGRAE